MNGRVMADLFMAKLLGNLKPCTHCGAEHDFEKCPVCGHPRAWSYSDDGSHRTPDHSHADYQTSGVAGRAIKQGE